MADSPEDFPGVRDMRRRLGHAIDVDRSAEVDNPSYLENTVR